MDESRPLTRCVWCVSPAIVIDNEYEEGYCRYHFNVQQAGSEPLTDYRDEGDLLAGDE